MPFAGSHVSYAAPKPCHLTLYWTLASDAALLHEPLDQELVLLHVALGLEPLGRRRRRAGNQGVLRLPLEDLDASATDLEELVGIVSVRLERLVRCVIENAALSAIHSRVALQEATGEPAESTLLTVHRAQWS